MEEWILEVYFREAGTVDFPLLVQLPHALGEQNKKLAIEACISGGLAALFGRYVRRWRVRQVDEKRQAHNDCFIVYADNGPGANSFYLFVMVPKSSASEELLKAILTQGLTRYLGQACKRISAKKAGETLPAATEGLLLRVS